LAYTLGKKIVENKLNPDLKRTCLEQSINTEILFISKWQSNKYISVVTNEYINITSDIINENIRIIGDPQWRMTNLGISSSLGKCFNI
jgi:hypothetical protein